MAEEERKLEITNERASDYRVVASNGAWAAIATQGMIFVELYAERPVPGGSTTLTADERGDYVSNDEETLSKTKIVRESQIGFMLSAEAAMAMAQLLYESATSLLEQPRGGLDRTNVPPVEFSKGSKKQVAALAMQGPRPKRDPKGWMKTVGKYPEDSRLNQIMDEGARIRESERSE